MQQTLNKPLPVALNLCLCSGVGGRAREDRRHKAQGGVSKRDWILHKKERARAQGKEGVKADTKYVTLSSCYQNLSHLAQVHGEETPAILSFGASLHGDGDIARFVTVTCIPAARSCLMHY